MTGARDVRLVRVPDLRAAQRAIALLSCAGEPIAARGRAVLVPTRHAALELRRSIERLLLLSRFEVAPDVLDRLGLDAPPEPRAAVLLPFVLTRGGLYRHLHRSLGPAAPPLVTAAERDALLWRASDLAIAAGNGPPFTVRPGLVSEMLRLYDGVRRNKRSVDDFERVMLRALEPGADADRGAARLLSQTRYLVSVFRGYESALAQAGTIDEHVLRPALLEAGGPPAFTHLVLTIADQAADPDGLWPADFDLLMRLPGLARLDVVATAGTLDAGVRERLFDVLPGIEECPWPQPTGRATVLLTPAPPDGRRHFLSRDREEELRAITEWLRAAGQAPSIPCSADQVTDPARDPAMPQVDIEDVLVVYERPLPYVYLAQRLLGDAGVPFTIADALPLAAEPYAAAVDLLFEAVLSHLEAEPLLGLLESPWFAWRPDGRAVRPRDVAAFRTWLRDRGFRGGWDAFAGLADAATHEADAASPSFARRARALDVARLVVSGLAPFDREDRLTAHVARLATLLRERTSSAGPPVDVRDGARGRRGDRRGVEATSAEDAAASRAARARGAILALLDELHEAYARHGDRVLSFGDVVPLVRRAIEEHTFTPVAGVSGVRLTDARSARYASASTVWLVGVVEGEWPTPTRRSVFYPSSLLAEVGFPREQDRVPAARAAFHDLLALAADRVAVSAFQLEEDAIVRPSVLLDDLDALALPAIAVPTPTAPAASVRRADASGPDRSGPEGTGSAAFHDDRAWRELRWSRTPAGDPRFHGDTGSVLDSTPSVTQVERYLDCPFKYFASVVLALDEEDAADDVGLYPRRRGTLVHDVSCSSSGPGRPRRIGDRPGPLAARAGVVRDGRRSGALGPVTCRPGDRARAPRRIGGRRRRRRTGVPARGIAPDTGRRAAAGVQACAVTPTSACPGTRGSSRSGARPIASTCSPTGPCG